MYNCVNTTCNFSIALILTYLLCYIIYKITYNLYTQLVSIVFKSSVENTVYMKFWQVKYLPIYLLVLF